MNCEIHYQHPENDFLAKICMTVNGFIKLMLKSMDPASRFLLQSRLII